MPDVDLVWLVFSGGHRSLSADWLEAITADEDDARRRMAAIMRQREEWAGPHYPITWEADTSAHGRDGRRGWGFQSSGGDKVRVEQWPVSAPLPPEAAQEPAGRPDGATAVTWPDGSVHVEQTAVHSTHV